MRENIFYNNNYNVVITSIGPTTIMKKRTRARKVKFGAGQLKLVVYRMFHKNGVFPQYNGPPPPRSKRCVQSPTAISWPLSDDKQQKTAVQGGEGHDIKHFQEKNTPIFGTPCTLQGDYNTSGSSRIIVEVFSNTL